MASIAMGIMGALGVAGSITSGVMGSNAATTAADQQAQSAQAALDFQKQVFATQQQNQAPYLTAGTQSLQQLMADLQSGKFGPGSLDANLPGQPPSAPGGFTAPAPFTAPTAEEARATPGYQFTRDQGSQGILRAAGAAGGTISGGTLKAMDQYNTGLADTTYNDTYNRALGTYNTNFQTGLSSYNANLQDYQAQLNQYSESLGRSQVANQAQNQEFNQLLAPVQLGEGAVQNVNNTGSQAAVNVGNLMTQIGNAQAAGTVGSANAISSGISGATNSLTQSLLYNLLFGGGAASKAPDVNPAILSQMGITTPVTAGVGPAGDGRK